ncbi:MAG: Dna2/Cas4 domain-containing protein [Actinophytocola sp.]|nr:Dna2/Cas4 domain-containing protein [Actinophytocola sp.]
MTQSATELPAAADTAERRKPALSPSRASDFKQCPLLYRFRAVDKIPEAPSKAQVRGTLVHAVLERLFALPAEERVLDRAKELLDPLWAELSAENPEWTALFSAEAAEADEDAADGEQAESDWLASAGKLLDSYFGLEDPSALEPQACEERVEVELGSGVRLRGYVDRIDVAETGEVRIVDYKTGAAPREIGEIKAMFQMKFYALVLWRLRGAVPDQLKLMYLTDGQSLTYAPDEAELRRFERTLEAIWQAILRAGKSGDFRPSKSKLCHWCDHKARCPEFGGTPPEYPGWPEPDGGDETALDRAD